jgi:hypothetical protein
MMVGGVASSGSTPKEHVVELVPSETVTTTEVATVCGAPAAGT